MDRNFDTRMKLIPGGFFSEELARNSLCADIPEYEAVLVYEDATGAGTPPELFYVLKYLPSIGSYNRIAASYGEGSLHLAVAQGDRLLLANAYEAMDFTTAEYFIFLAMKKLQLNPEVSSISFLSPLSEAEKMSLYRYFKAVEQP